MGSGKPTHMNDTFLTFTQALQLVGLGPSLFLVAFLLLTMKRPSHVVVPVGFFLALSAGFIEPLLTPLDYQHTWLHGVTLIGQSMIPAMSFLLVIQLTSGKMPSPWYWLVLCVPVFGGGLISYAATMTSDELCIGKQICTTAEHSKILYGVFSASALFLLLVVVLSRIPVSSQAPSANKTHQYWLIISLILLSLCVLAVDLALLKERLTSEQHVFSVTALRIGYLYLVITSIFRVFDRQFEIDAARIPSMNELILTDQDQKLWHKIESLVRDQKQYREMGFSREKLASHVAASEHQVSKVINRLSGKNFNRYVNHYRVEEAKERLLKEPTTITVIAFEVGFNSIASFNRVFKEETGVSPTEFREAYGGLLAAGAGAADRI